VSDSNPAATSPDDHPTNDHSTAAAGGPLQHLRVLDLTDERGIYGAKLLADLGARVLRPEPPGGDPLRQRGPHAPAAGAQYSSLWYAFFSSNRDSLVVDREQPADLERLEAFAATTDIVLMCDHDFAISLVDVEALQRANPALMVVDVSSFGPQGPWANYMAPDLIAGALAGAVATTGDVDTPPIKSFGELNFMVSGVYAAIAALAGLHHATKSGQGQSAHVSVHESIASCLEQVFMFYWYSERMLRPEGPVLPRRGSLHWSNVYQVMNAHSGSIMITPTPDFDRQLAWLIEDDAHGDLIDPVYEDPANLALRAARTMELLREWVAGKDAQTLFEEAQQRHIPYGWVLPIERVADNPQLAARDWYVPLRLGATTVTCPGAPYQFSRTPWSLSDHVAVGEMRQDLDWQPREDGEPSRPADPANKRAKQAPSNGDNAQRPLAGLRILDFSHVLAGPFATRVLADMGADVVKINSASRAIAANEPGHPYYVMWNRNKRALSLDMSNADARALCRQLCEQADVVIDNFSVGVLDRWGVGYESVSESHPGVIYIQMSGMGEGGPWSHYVTYAPTIHALAGLTTLTGMPDREDIGIGFSYNDHQAGLHGAFAILAALAHRAATGEGQRIDVSQFEVGVNFAGPSLLDLFANGNLARACGNDLPYDEHAPHNVYRCADVARREGEPEPLPTMNERWIAIACVDDAHWQALCLVLAEDDESSSDAWYRNAKYIHASGRYAARDAIDKHLSAWTCEQEEYALMARLQAAGVPAGVVQDGRDLAERDPQLAASGFLHMIEGEHPQLGQTWADKLPIHFSDTPCVTYTRARTLGEDNAAILQDWLTLNDDEVRALAAQRILD